MSNPLDSITRRLRWLIRVQTAKDHAGFVSYDQQERIRLARIEERQRLDELVIGTLEKFGSLAHPSMFVRVYDEAWSLGHWENSKLDNSRIWVQAVDVILRFDKWNRALYLECNGMNRRLRSPLDAGALNKALVQLHPQPQRRDV